MVFSSLYFLFLYLPIVLLIYYIAPLRLRNAVLLVFNLIFYGWGEPKYILIMFASIAISGIQLITKYGITSRIITIVSVSLGVGYGLGVTSGAIVGLGSAINLVFGGGGIVPAALLAIVLNVLIPKGKDDLAAEEAAAHLEALKAQKLAEQE